VRLRSTGSWFAFQQHDVSRLVVFAKGVNSVRTLGGVILNEAISGLQRARLSRRSHVSVTTRVRRRSRRSKRCRARNHENAQRIGDEVLRRTGALRTSTASSATCADSACSSPRTRDESRDQGTARPYARARRDEHIVRPVATRTMIFTNFNRIHVVPPCTITQPRPATHSPPGPRAECRGPLLHGE